MVHSAQDQGWEGRLHLIPNLYPSRAEITAHSVEERHEERTKTPYSLDTNLITTRLSIGAKRRVVSRFPYNTSGRRRTKSRCASPRHARDLSLIFDGFTDLVKTFNQDHHSFVAHSVAHISLNY